MYTSNLQLYTSVLVGKECTLTTVCDILYILGNVLILCMPVYPNNTYCIPSLSLRNCMYEDQSNASASLFNHFMISCWLPSTRSAHTMLGILLLPYIAASILGPLPKSSMVAEGLLGTSVTKCN